MSPILIEGGGGVIDLEGGTGDDLLLEGEGEEGEEDTGVGSKIVCCYRRRRR